MADSQPSRSWQSTAIERRRQRARDRHHSLSVLDPEYGKKRYRRWLELHPDGNREAYLKRLKRQGKTPGQKQPRTKCSHEEKIAKQRERDRKKYLRNREHRIKATALRQKQRYHEDPEYMLRIRLRNRIRYALNAGHGKKVRRSQELLGCPSDAFVKHIESLFEDGMCWENKSQWHIDHIIPVAAFDLTTLDGQQAAFHFTNLRPAWAEDNRRKNAKIPLPQKMFSFGYVAYVDKKAGHGTETKSRKGRKRD
jgi:hypothetical protein